MLLIRSIRGLLAPLILLLPAAAQAGWLHVCNRGSMNVNLAVYSATTYPTNHSVEGWFPLRTGKCWSRHGTRPKMVSIAIVALDSRDRPTPLVFRVQSRGGRFTAPDGICVDTRRQFRYRGRGTPSTATSCPRGQVNFPVSFSVAFQDNEDTINIHPHRGMADDYWRGLNTRTTPAPEETTPPKPPSETNPVVPTPDEIPEGHRALTQEERRRCIVLPIYKYCKTGYRRGSPPAEPTPDDGVPKRPPRPKTPANPILG